MPIVAVHTDDCTSEGVDAFLNGTTNVFPWDRIANTPEGYATKVVIPSGKRHKQKNASRYRFDTSRELDRIAGSALLAKPEHASTRTQLRFPYYRGQYSKKRKSTYQRSIRTHFVRWGLRIMTDAHLAGVSPTVEQLESIFLEVGRAKAVTYSTYDQQGGGRRVGTSMDDLQRTAESAVSAVMDIWSPDYTAIQRRRGAAGGRSSRRGPSTTIEDVQRAEAAAEAPLTHAELARVLGCSVETVKRRRRELRAPHLS